MRRGIGFLIGLLLACVIAPAAFGQGIRFDSAVTQQGTIGTATNAVVIPAAPQVAFCNFPANAVPCTNRATTYTTNTLGTPCSTSTQIVLTGTTACVASPYSSGNWGVWAAAGQYAYTVTLPGGIDLGPYNVTLGIPTGTNLSLGTLTVAGALNSNNLAAGNVANKEFSGYAVQFVSSSGNDANDGLSSGTAKATISAAIGVLPNCTPIPSVGFSVSPTAPCGTIYVATNASGYTLSSGVTVNGLMIRIAGLGKTNVTINCTAAACFTFNNQSPYAFSPSMSTDGGLYNLTLNGNGSASQLGVLCKTCDGMVVHDVRFSNFSGAGANAFEFLNDATGGITERNDWNNIAFDNDTNGILMTTTGATNNTSFGHNAFRHLQWSLSKNQTAWTLGGSGTNGGAGLYGSYIDGLINSSDVNPADTGLAVSISGTAKVLGNFRLIIDNGGGMTITACSGCTTSNFAVWGFGDGASAFDASNGNLTATNSGIRMNATASVAGTGPAWFLNDAIKFHADLDGSGFLEFTNSSAVPVFGLSQTGIVNQTGLQLFNTTTTCTTAATINTPCTTAAITLPVAYSDTNYRILCQGLGPTNFPQLQTVTKSNTTFTITLNNLTAAAATYSSFDCSAVHN